MDHLIKKIQNKISLGTQLSIDSRNINPGCIFIALKGENFDGNNYASEAISKGAHLAIIDDESFIKDDRYLLVENTLDFLQNLARYHRDQFNIPVIAITGSNGKTTTKEFTAEVLSRKYVVLSTSGNLNNHIGVPLTLLELKNQHEFAIIEMGANHPGEIGMLCKLANPDYGLITNVGKAHLEGFGGFEGVVKAKTELYDYLRINNGTAFVHQENVILMEKSIGIKRLTYGAAQSSDFSCKLIESEPFVKLLPENSSVAINSNLYGAYNFDNICAALCLGWFFGVEERDCKEAVENYIPENNRSQLLETNHNHLYLDAYNANPSSMEAAIRNFHLQQLTNKVLILGDMFELGSESPAEHQKITNIVEELDFKDVFFVGKDFYQTQTEFHKFRNVEAFLSFLTEYPITGKSVLIKGSRGMQMERLRELL